MTDLGKRIGWWLSKTGRQLTLGPVGRWQPRMKTVCGWTLLRPTDLGKLDANPIMMWLAWRQDGEFAGVHEIGMHGRAPDFDDGPTRGALEDLLWERWPFARINYDVAERRWRIDKSPGSPSVCWGGILGETLTRALIIAYDIPKYDND